jgi:hypothetical protein
MWQEKNILLGWQIGNTIYIALDVRSPLAIVNQIEKHYDNKKSYVFLLVDALKIDTLSIHSVMRSVHGKNSLSIYSLAPNTINPENLNLENNMINIPGYYGLLGNLFRISYY